MKKYKLIVFEGADNTGKSTIAKKIVKKLYTYIL